MYVDFRNDWPPPEPLKPERPKRRLNKRQETVVLCIIGFNLLMLIVGPLAGATLFEAVIATLRALASLAF
jgi:hypothetical protein